jgi:hypothetical protein
MSIWDDLYRFINSRKKDLQGYFYKSWALQTFQLALKLKPGIWLSLPIELILPHPPKKW